MEVARDLWKEQLEAYEAAAAALRDSLAKCMKSWELFNAALEGDLEAEGEVD